MRLDSGSTKVILRQIMLGSNWYETNFGTYFVVVVSQAFPVELSFHTPGMVVPIILYVEATQF